MSIIWVTVSQMMSRLLVIRCGTQNLGCVPQFGMDLNYLGYGISNDEQVIGNSLRDPKFRLRTPKLRTPVWNG